MTKTAIMEPLEQEDINLHGFIIHKKYGEIEAITHGHQTLRIGQKVVAEGFLVPAGTWGLVVGIKEPGTVGRTSDVLDVWFESKKSPTAMKFKDLQF